MKKYKIQFTNSVSVGNNSPTALNVLLGANSKDQFENESKKILLLHESEFPISFLTDLSLFKAKKGNELWRQVVRDSRFLSGTVPVYQAVGRDKTIDPIALLEIIEEQAEFGVKLISIHPTPTMELIRMSKKRLCPITSRGGAVVCVDMVISQRKQNVYMEILDQILQIAKKHGVVISIGSSFRSANLHDAFDCVYQTELSAQIELANYCMKKGVSVILETPGHAAPQHIFQICDKLQMFSPFPIMPLGPMPTDCALEQDDFAASVGAVLMGTRGCADILSVVTCEEHTGGIPTMHSLLSALRKYSVAKHIIDIYKLKDCAEDDKVSTERSNSFTCIYSEDSKCTRCGVICPLKQFSILNGLDDTLSI